MLDDIIHLYSFVFHISLSKEDTIIKELLLDRLKLIENELINLKKDYSNQPPGKLICVNNGKYTKWYNSHDGITEYIPKGTPNIAKTLAYKKFILAKINDLEKESRAIKSYLRILGDNSNKAEKLINNPAFQQLITKPQYCFSEQLNEWLASDYRKCTKHPEHLIHKSTGGAKLRSKSEANIHSALCLHNIPFRYEAELVLSGNVIYPDFTLRHPHTGEKIYWEHFGLISQPDYRKDFLFKMNLYTSNGIIPSINLITSYETPDKPYTFYDAEQTLKQFFDFI